MKITYDNLELYDSESFICLGLGETTVRLGDATEKLTIVFDFQSVTGKQEGEVRFELVDSITLRIVLTNWNSPLGATLTQPLKGGELFGRELLLAFSVRKVGAVGEFREVQISAYLGREIKNGAN